MGKGKSTDEHKINNPEIKESLSLETGLQNLEMIVKSLEEKDLPLEKALNLFKDGVILVQHCSNVLDQAEKQMELLLEEPDGSLKLMPANFLREDEPKRVPRDV